MSSRTLRAKLYSIPPSNFDLGSRQSVSLDACSLAANRAIQYFHPDIA